MEGMRDVLRQELRNSMRAVPEQDRLAAAWVVACGKVLAEHGVVSGYADEVVHVAVSDKAWLRQMMTMRGQLAAELSRIAGVKVREIHFEMKRMETR